MATRKKTKAPVFATDTRSARAHIRVTPDELAEIQNAAAREERDVSQWARLWLLRVARGETKTR